MILAIDPGVDSGWAILDTPTRALQGCGLGSPNPTGRSFDRIIIECPKLRPWGEKNPNAILTLARNAGQWGGRLEHLGPVEFILPNDWKGSVKKEISHSRLWAKLSSEEKDVVDAAFKAHPGRNGMAPSKRHNVLDAIGIALWGVGR